VTTDTVGSDVWSWVEAKRGEARQDGLCNVTVVLAGWPVGMLAITIANVIVIVTVLWLNALPRNGGHHQTLSFLRVLLLSMCTYPSVAIVLSTNASGPVRVARNQRRSIGVSQRP
jgi:hypothetical protein